MITAIRTIDTLLFYKINSLAGLSVILDNIFIFITLNFYWLIWLLFLLMLIITVDDVSLGRRIKRVIKRTSEFKKIDFNLLTAVIASSGISYLASQLIGLWAERSRPFIGLDGVAKLISDPVSIKSFPSDHTVLSFAIALSVFYRHKKWGTFFIIIASLIGLSRIYVGVHYPLDVVAGILVAWAASWLMKKMIYK